jgi:hypothetical protein
MICRVIVFLSALLLSASASAETSTVQNNLWAIGPVASTLGVGVQASYLLHPRFVVRAEATYGTLSKLGTSATDLNVKSAGLLFDLHPFKTSFRITGGGRYLDYRFKIEKPDFDLVNNVDFNKVYSVSGTTKIAPYAGIGFDSAHYGGNAVDFHLGLDVGVVFGTNPKAAFDQSAVKLSSDEIKQDLASVTKEHSYLDYYPVVTLGARLSF